MATRDWHDDWRILDLNRDMSIYKEVEAGHEQILAGDKMTPNNPRTIKTQCNKIKGLCPRRTHNRGRRKTPRHHKNRKERLRKKR